MAENSVSSFYNKVGNHFSSRLKTVDDPIKRNAAWLNKILDKYGIVDFSLALKVFLVKIERIVMYSEYMVECCKGDPKNVPIIEAIKMTEKLNEILGEALIENSDTLQHIGIKLLHNDVQQIITAMK